MVETNITRRRVLQGAGAIGVASLGSTVVSAQEDGGGQGDQSAAVRVAHASPDAPNVDVRFNSQDVGGGGATGDNETGGNETGGEQGDDGGPEIGGLAFRDVSGYNELDPGSYQVQIVPAEGGLLEGFVEDLFGGGGEDEQTVLFEDQIDVEQGTTYTLVAFGEVAQGPVPAEGAEMEDAGQNETDGVGLDENATVGGENETDGIGMDGNETDGAGAGQNETEGLGGDGAGAQGEQLVDELSFGESQTVELEAGDYSLEVREAGAAGVEAGGANGMAGNETDGAGLNETVGADGGENETDGVGMDGNETAAGDGGAMAGEAGGDRGFRVQVLEDDITDPGDDTARVRLFHAVPDVDTVSISRIEDAEPGAGGGAGQNETDVGAGGEDPGQGEGDGVGAGQEDGGAGQEEGDGAGAGQTDGGAGAERDEGVRRATLSVDGNTVYSSFAVGYFDPEAAAAAGDDGGAPADAGNDSDGIGAGQEDGGAGAGQNETGGGDGEGIAEDPEGEEFELVTVEDAQGGERSDGGTGGLLDLAAAADD